MRPVNRRDDIQYAVLGPFEVRAGGRPVPVGGLRQRSVLAFLLLHAGQVVSLDRLADEVWDGDPPRAAEATVRAYVSHLRKALAGPTGTGAPLVTRSSGYLLDVDPRQVDAEEFERLAAEGRHARDIADYEAAGQLLRAALRLWRGPALADFAQGWAGAHATRLDELRHLAAEARFDVDLAAGRHAELVSELAMAVAEHPLRERLHAHRMLALYRCGRQADALDAYREAYAMLSDAHGLEPGRDLRELQAAILRQDQELRWAPPERGRDDTGTPAPVPAQLPADIADFTGRTDDLAVLDDLARARHDAPVMTVAAIAGAAGVGKTALAVHWAHRVAGEFPDGQLYINLRGHDPARRLSAFEALAQFLRALGVDSAKIPATEEEAAAVYRSRLSGRCVLVVLDNAGSVDQVRPLLPGATGCLVLVTSRDRLTGLIARDGARRLTVDVLDADEAVALVGRIVGADRVGAEPAAAAELAQECVHLPLALRIAAANLLNQPRRSIADHVAELRADRLAVLRVEGDEQSAVRVAFEQSYTALPPDAGRVFRLLGLVPGPDFTAEATAALAGTTPAGARRMLDRLAGAHLIETRTTDRYTFHDLLRLFARERTEVEDDPAARLAASGRLFDWYSRGVDAAARSLYPEALRLPSATAADNGDTGYAGPRAALSWLDAERPNLVGAVTHTARHGPRTTAYLLADGLRGYFWISRHTTDWLSVAHAGQAAARAAGDARAEAAAELSLAQVYRCLTRYAESAAHYERAIALSERAGWRLGQTAGMNNLGCMYVRLGELTRAEDMLLRALELNTAHRHHHVTNLGYAYHRQGRLTEAERLFTDAVAVRRALNDRYGEAEALQGLGECHHSAGRFDLALDDLARALSVFQEIGSLDGEAQVRCVRAAVHRDSGRYRKARDHAQLALTLAHRTGDRYTEALARNRFGDALFDAGRFAEARAQHSAAHVLARKTDAPLPEVDALIGLVANAAREGRYDEARALADEAAVLAHRVGLRVLEGQALSALASTELGLGRRADAAAHAREALEIQRRTGSRLGEAHARTVLGGALDGAAAREEWRLALAIATEIGWAEADRLRALLAEAPATETSRPGLGPEVGAGSR